MSRIQPRRNVFRANLQPPTKPSPIPEDQRVPEDKIDFYNNARAQFKVNMMEVSRLTGITYNRLVRVFRKETWLSLSELQLIDKAMVHIILQDKERQARKKKERTPSKTPKKNNYWRNYWDTHFLNIYDRPQHPRALAQAKIPPESRASEETIDALADVWRQHRINIYVVAAKCGMKSSRAYKILNKTTWGSVQEADAIAEAMIDILDSRKGYNSGKNPQRK